SNAERLWNVPSRTPYVKDGIHEAVVGGARGRVNPDLSGTKATVHYASMIEPGRSETILLRLSARPSPAPFADAALILAARAREADAFFDGLGAPGMPEDARRVQRQAFAGLLWSKQYYEYDVARWLEGDPAGPPPDNGRRNGRNAAWSHLKNADVLSMPDK